MPPASEGAPRGHPELADLVPGLGFGGAPGGTRRIFSGSARGRRSRNHDHSYVTPGCNHILTLLLECEVMDGGRTNTPSRRSLSVPQSTPHYDTCNAQMQVTNYRALDVGLSPDTSLGLISSIWSMISSKPSSQSIFSYCSFGQIAMAFQSRALQSVACVWTGAIGCGA